MGYSMRTKEWHYTEWVDIRRLGHHQYQPNWDKQADHEELYDLENDPQENFNLYDKEEFADVKKQLSILLRAGWREHNSI